MENNSINTEVNTATPAETKGEQKTFTQDDVNRIVQDRLAKDRAKASEEMGKREQELNEREFRLNSRQKLIDRGLPEDWTDVLNCSSESAFDAALNKIEAFIKERTPSAEQLELENKAARFVTAPKFTAPMKQSSGMMREDPIKKAMNLN